MATTYLHGAYGAIGATQAQSAAQSGTIPVYFGTAPVNLVRGYREKGLVNKPVKLTNWSQAQNTVGYSSDWQAFSLCEALDVHFNNTLGNCGPVYFVNVLDPDVHKKTGDVTKALTFTNGRAEFLSDTIILDTFALADKAEGVDYSLSYNFAKKSVVVTLRDASIASANATYNEVDMSKVDAEDIVGGVTSEGEYSGIGALALLYQNEFKVANILAAPGWSHLPEVYNAMVTASQKINGHWMAFVCADIPLEGVSTRTAAIAWKKSHGYTSMNSKVCWPMGTDSEGKVYHLSTLCVWRFQMTDADNGGVPGETCSNKAVPVIRQYFGAGAKNQGFDKESGNELNEYGITTVVPSDGKWVLWGGHTAAYTFGVTSDPLEIFDTNVRMLDHVVNSFQKEWEPRIDKPMTLQLKDQILNRENDKLAGYVAQGFLIGNPKCIFLESDNSTKDLMNGDFKWNLTATPTPQFKSGTISVAYTDAGFSVYAASEDK